MARPCAGASSSRRLAVAPLLVLVGCLGRGFVGSLPGRRGTTRSRFFAATVAEEEAAPALGEAVQEEEEAQEVEPPADEERAAAPVDPALALVRDPFAFMHVGENSDIRELPKGLVQLLRRSPTKFVTLWLKAASARWKLLRTLRFASRPENVLWAQVLPRLRDRQMRLRVISGLPLALPGDGYAGKTLKVSKTTDHRALTKSMVAVVNEQRHAFVKLLAGSPEAEAVTLLALEGLQKKLWFEISFTVDRGGATWVHVQNAQPSGTTLWKLFPRVDDAGNETGEALAERVAALLEVHSLQYVDLTSQSGHAIIATLAALPPELRAASLIAHRRPTGHAGGAFRARIAKGMPEQTIEPSFTYRVSEQTDQFKLTDSLRVEVSKRNCRVVQLEAAGPHVAAKAFLALEAAKWRVQELAFTAAESNGAFVLTVTFL